MSTQRETIWLGRNNVIGLLLKADGAAYDLSNATRLELVFSGTTISSVGHSMWFDWTSATLATGQVNLLLGGVTNVVPGTYKTEVIYYDVNNVSGIMWGRVPMIVRG